MRPGSSGLRPPPIVPSRVKPPWGEDALSAARRVMALRKRSYVALLSALALIGGACSGGSSKEASKAKVDAASPGPQTNTGATPSAEGSAATPATPHAGGAAAAAASAPAAPAAKSGAPAAQPAPGPQPGLPAGGGGAQPRAPPTPTAAAPG